MFRMDDSHFLEYSSIIFNFLYTHKVDHQFISFHHHYHLSIFVHCRAHITSMFSHVSSSCIQQKTLSMYTHTDTSHISHTLANGISSFHSPPCHHTPDLNMFLLLMFLVTVVRFISNFIDTFRLKFKQKIFLFFLPLIYFFGSATIVVCNAKPVYLWHPTRCIAN